ncbi:MAG: VacJ family lipoprotein [Gammaproteobacteria bacterium]|nr:VacJ family lipoprotein [Gammaproteobacteria bacterium]MDP2142002.1 VacJ family lipoprotein [Gammaproteobacteria bacterium]MDP2348419.1 VacJ family lipoprotein [Gammaproteobacteria bacterium]
MRFKKFAPQALALAVFCCAGMGVSVNVSAQPDDPLAGTGITPNVISFDDSTIMDSETGEVRDPLIRLNRAVFAFNDVSYRYAIIPAARVYQNGIPAPLRTGVGNFFDNIKSPILFTNHLLQIKPREAGVDLARFVINTTIGLAGLFDPATTMFDLQRDETSLSETLMRYGTGHGTYIVLPFIGPSNVRDGSAMFVDGLLNPLRYVLDNPESGVVRVFDNFQEFAPSAESYLTMRAESQDLYIFMRNLHLQGVQRDAAYQ